MGKKIAWYLTVFFCSWGIIYKLNIIYKFDDFKEYATILINSSGMVFTIMGIWIAFLYPNALSRIVNPNIVTADFSESLQETKRLEAIVGSVLKSAIVVLMVMLIFLGKVVLFKTYFYGSYFEIIKSFILSFIVFLTYIQAEAIWHVVYSNIMFINDLHRRREDREEDADV